MTPYGIAQIVLFYVIVIALAKPIGLYMANVYNGHRTWFDPLLKPVERGVYRLAGIDPEHDMHWTTYLVALLLFSLAGLLLTYLILRAQGMLPLNPQGLGPVPADLALNTAVSFTTNTNWQNYAGESTMSYFSQMVGLATHNFMSAATGMAIAVGLIRGFARRSANGIGNFWVDMTRSILYILLPICIVGTLVLVQQGVIQTFAGYPTVTTLEGAQQTLAMGPVASQEIIKEVGTNGGGFFNANSAHPFENPTPFSNYFEMIMILLIPAGLTYTFGRMVGDTRQGWVLLSAMTVISVVMLAIVLASEQAGNPNLTALGVNQGASALQAGGNMEGKEVRFGIAASTLFANVTTDASCGAVNSMHDSYTALGGFVPLFNILLGEVVFGGVGAGLYGILVFAVAAVFIAGLMVGRTPEYLGKKIEAYEMKMVMLILLILPLSILVPTGIAVLLDAGKAGIVNPGAHGFSEVLYAYTSGTGNNGSAFAGLSANSPWYNGSLSMAMLAGRFMMIVPVMALAGSVARKQVVPPSLGTFPTNGGTFAGLLVGVIVVVGALTYFPAVALGPIVEFFQQWAGHLVSM